MWETAAGWITANVVSYGEFGAWTKASFFSLAVTEIIKRCVRIALAKKQVRRDIDHTELWALSTLIAALSYIPLAVELPSVLIPIWMMVPIVGASTPVTHWLFVNNFAKALQYGIKKATGFELNIKEIAAGREYVPRAQKVIATKQGDRLVPLDHPTNYDDGEFTRMVWGADGEVTQPRGDADEGVGNEVSVPDLRSPAGGAVDRMEAIQTREDQDGGTEESRARTEGASGVDGRTTRGAGQSGGEHQ